MLTMGRTRQDNKLAIQARTTHTCKHVATTPGIVVYIYSASYQMYESGGREPNTDELRYELAQTNAVGRSQDVEIL